MSIVQKIRDHERLVWNRVYQQIWMGGLWDSVGSRLWNGLPNLNLDVLDHPIFQKKKAP